MSNFISEFFSSGVEGAAKGLGTMAKDIRTAITGKEPVSDGTRLRLEEIAVQLELAELALPAAVNQTMQVEAGSEHWPQYSWRPFWGFISGFAFLFVVVLCCVLGYNAVIDKNPDALRMIPDLVTAFATLFAIPGAILGVTAWHRGALKRDVVNKQ
jgi:hypothetical protein